MFRGSEIPDEWAEFLERSLIARLATLDRAGFPHVTPVWFGHEDGLLFVTTTRAAAKYRHVMRDPRVGIVIDDPVMPYRVVTVRGRASVRTEDVEEVTWRIAARYWPGWDVEHLVGELLAEARVILAIAPERVVAWTE